MAPTEPTIEEALTAADLPDAEALVREAGWNQIVADWEIFRALGTVYTARSGQRVIATAATLPYGKFAWISMVLVAGEERRHGLGTRLLKRCIAALNDQGCVPVLDATPAGLPLYHALGFKETWGYHRLARPNAVPKRDDTHPAGDGMIIRPIADADWPALCALDAVAFGAERSALLGRLRGRVPAAELVAERHGRMAGFLLGRNGRSASQIGPLIAEDDDAALGLLARALPAIDGPVYVDFADSKARTRAWLADCGFATQRPLTRMLLGQTKGFGDTKRTFAVAGPELG
jgi:GNAT superfamily N-acetyltransferase